MLNEAVMQTYLQMLFFWGSCFVVYHVIFTQDLSIAMPPLEHRVSKVVVLFQDKARPLPCVPKSDAQIQIVINCN